MGGDSRGRVIHARADGTSRTLYDAPEDEIRALAVGADGASTRPRSAPRRTAQEDDEAGEAKPAPARSAVSGGRATRLPHRAGQRGGRVVVVPAAVRVRARASPRGIFVATGNRAGVYLLERGNGATQFLAAPEGQITALAVDARRARVRGGSNPGALWRLGPGRAERGELLSSVLDGAPHRALRAHPLAGRARRRPRRAEHAQRQHGPAGHDVDRWEGGAVGAEGRDRLAAGALSPVAA